VAVALGAVNCNSMSSIVSLSLRMHGEMRMCSNHERHYGAFGFPGPPSLAAQAGMRSSSAG
jgi:hypothetical protein